MLKNDKLITFNHTYPMGTGVTKTLTTVHTGSRISITLKKEVLPSNNSKLGVLGVSKIETKRTFSTKYERGPYLKLGNPITKVSHNINFFSEKGLIHSASVKNKNDIKLFYIALKHINLLEKPLTYPEVQKCLKKLRKCDKKF